MIRSFTACFTFVVIITEVSSWTLDLAEVTKFLLERGEAPQKDHLQNANIDKNGQYDASKYAKDYEYQRFKIKETDNVIGSGSQYLDGLSKALLEYRELVDKCNRSQGSTIRPIAQLLGRKPPQVTDEMCERVMRKNQYIRELSEVVLLTTSSMRDKTDKDYKDEAETALLARLAWLLERLAHLTGYESAKTSVHTGETERTTQNSISALEIMEPVENGRVMSNLPPKQMSTKTKRSVNNPLEEVTNYYLKYKAWTSSNPDDAEGARDSNYDVQNYLKVKPLQKRSVEPKKAINVRIIDHKSVFPLKKPETHLKTKIALHRIIGAALKIKKGVQKVKSALKHV